MTGQVDRALPWADAMDKNALARLLQHVAERAEYDPFPPGILDGLGDLERDLIDAICGAINMNGDADVYHNEISDLRAEIESLRSSRDGYRQALEDTLGRLERAAADARAAATASRRALGDRRDLLLETNSGYSANSNRITVINGRAYHAGVMGL